MRPDAIRDAGLRELGARERLQRIATDEQGMSRSFKERCRLLDEYKLELKKHHREVALECHPDRNREAPAEECLAKEERFKRITQAVDFLMTLSPSPPRPKPRPPVSQMRPHRVIVVMNGQPISLTDFRHGSVPGMNTTTTNNFWRHEDKPRAKYPWE